MALLISGAYDRTELTRAPLLFFHNSNHSQVFSWKNIKEAHEEMEANKNTGKIVIRVD